MAQTSPHACSGRHGRRRWPSIACTSQAGPASRRRRPVRRAGLLQDRRASGTTRSRSASRRSATWARPTASPSPRPRTPTPFTTANLAQYEAVVFLNTTGDVLNATQQTAFESYIRAGGGYVGVHAAADTEYDWPFYGNLVGRLLRLAPGDPAGQRQGGEPGARGDRAPAADLDPHRRVVQLPDQPAVHRPRAGHARRVVVLRRRRWAPTTRIAWCKTYEGGRSFYTGGGHTQAVVRRAGLPRPPARRHPVRGRPHQGRLPAGDRLHRPSTTDRPPAGRRPGRAASPTPTPRSPRSAAWACSGTAPSSSRSYSLKLDWRLAGDDNSGVFVGFPAGERPVVGGEQRLRGPDRRHRRGRPHHRRGLHASSRPTSPPATPRSTRRGSGTPTRSWSRASGCGSSSTACRSTTSPTPTRPASLRRLHRHPEPRHRRRRRRSATSGSRSSAARRRPVT